MGISRGGLAALLALAAVLLAAGFSALALAAAPSAPSQSNHPAVPSAHGASPQHAAHTRRCRRGSHRRRDAHGHLRRCARHRHSALSGLAPAGSTGGSATGPPGSTSGAPAGGGGAATGPATTTIPTTTTPTTTPAEAGAPAPPASVPRVQVTAVEYSLTLSRSSVPAGKVIFEFVNRGQDEHNLNVMPAEGAPAGSFPDSASGGVSDQAMVLRAGAYTMFCSLPEHEQKGMKASLIVQ